MVKIARNYVMWRVNWENILKIQFKVSCEFDDWRAEAQPSDVNERKFTKTVWNLQLITSLQKNTLYSYLVARHVSSRQNVWVLVNCLHQEKCWRFLSVWQHNVMAWSREVVRDNVIAAVKWLPSNVQFRTKERRWRRGHVVCIDDVFIHSSQAFSLFKRLVQCITVKGVHDAVVEKNYGIRWLCGRNEC